ncbi:MAG: tyrosine-type recombinase/integrase [Planctomycetota bacterium]|jgi:integrase
MPRKKKEILISVVRRSDRAHLVYQWEDRIAGTRGSESAGTSSRRTANSHEKKAALIESIVAKRRPKSTDPTWEAFRTRYERSKKTEWRPSSLANWVSAANALERCVEIGYLSDLDASAIDEMRVALHGTVAPSSIDSYLRPIRAAARWAAEIYPNYTPPKFRIQRAPSKGRPLADEEFQRMIDACADIVGEKNAGSWRFLLRGLVHSGLRLGQAMQFSWDIEAPVHVENLDGQFAKIVILHEEHKGKRESQLAMQPPMVKLLRQVPAQQRAGFVFNPRGKRGVVRDTRNVSGVVCRIGEKAGIVTGKRLEKKKDKKTGRMKVIGETERYAGAHDLKRTCGERLLRIGTHPATIARLLQHRTFDVTQQHYLANDVREDSKYLQGLFEAAKEE